MKLLELHILQSFPVSCLNRDDVGAPKSAVFGGAMRARISSQCLKRAIRRYAKELYPTPFQGQRSRLIVRPLRDEIVKQGIDESQAKTIAERVADVLASFDKEEKVKTLIFLSPNEISTIAKELAETLKKDQVLAEMLKKDPKSKDLKGKFEKLTKAAARKPLPKDAADIAIFGRMVANDATLTMEGAGLFSHALSTHCADNEIDFFAAVDDCLPKSEAGAGMIGILEFNSACYYRYAALNLDILRKHLKVLSSDELREVVDVFIRATLLAVPEARKNSMNAHTVSAYTLGIVKTKGQPIQLANAFESPLRAKADGLIKVSIDALENEYNALKETWGITAELECRIPGKTLQEFCTELLSHL
jgi:CRISPR system Cascade subunit CasC